MKRTNWLTKLGLNSIILLVIAGCSNSNSGHPSSAERASSPSPTAANSDPPSSRQGSSDNPFEGMVACDVLDTALSNLSDWDFPDGEYDKSGGDNGCRSGIPQKVSVGLTLQPDGTLEDFVDDPAKSYDGDVKGRPAMEERDGYEQGSCMLAMAVGANNRALLGVTSSMTRDEGCDLVEDHRQEGRTATA